MNLLKNITKIFFFDLNKWRNSSKGNEIVLDVYSNSKHKVNSEFDELEKKKSIF